MNLLLILIAIFGIYLLLLIFLPKGSPLHEMIHLLPWWVRLRQSPRDKLLITKHFYGKHFRQYVLFIRPENRKPDKKNVILYFHGGGWQFARPENFRPNARVWTEEGYAVFMPSHRRVPFFNYEYMREDLDLILKKVLEVMTANGLASKKIIPGGMSSGGNLAALLLYDREALVKLNCPGELFSGLFLLAAPMNLNLMRPSPTLHWYAGKRGTRKFKKANPIEYLKGDEITPVLGFHGTKDGMVEYESACSFYEKRKAGNPETVRFITLKEGTHLEVAGWSFIRNEVKKALLNWLEEREA